jgi:hypothetical protein
MLKILRKNIVIVFLFAALLTVSSNPLCATWNVSQCAEVATAALRGVGSSIEYRLKNDDTTRAHVKRMLISLLRITHDVLLIKNHPADYHSRYFGSNWLVNAYCDGCLMVDSIDAISNLFALLDSILEEDSGPFQLPGQFMDTLAKRDKPTLEYIKKYVLPACESFAALYLAISNDRSAENQKKRFIARTMLSLSRSFHDLLSQKGSSRVTTTLFIVMQMMYAGYQLSDEDSDFSTWLARRPVDESRLPNPEPEPARIARDEMHDRQAPEHVVAPQVPLTAEQREADRVARLAALRQRGIIA